MINNYNLCCTSKTEKNITRAELKKFASRLELQAVMTCLEASLYRQSMLKIIADVKNNTAHYKMHKKLAIFLDTPPKTADAVVQTLFETSPVEKSDFCTQIDIKPPCHHGKILQSVDKIESIDEKLINNLQNNSKHIVKIDPEPVDQDKSTIITNKEPEEVKEKIEKKFQPDNNETIDNINTSVREIFGESNENHNPVDNDGEEESRDSLMQHMEDMFCESDDSSDLMTLIEKHSGISKSNMDTEISKMCPEITVKNPIKPPPSFNKYPKTDSTDINACQGHQSGTKRKMSFSNYKRMRKRALAAPGTLDEEIKEDKHTKKMRGIWFVERVHQVSKLKAKMMELSTNNYRKHGKLRKKFHELFGESDEEEMMPESPIHIEEHLTACKERIAPWVVKYLMPFYSKKLIKDRLLFKAVAKHITDTLIIKNTFPGML